MNARDTTDKHLRVSCVWDELLTLHSSHSPSLNDTHALFDSDEYNATTEPCKYGSNCKAAIPDAGTRQPVKQFRSAKKNFQILVQLARPLLLIGQTLTNFESNYKCTKLNSLFS